MLDDFLDGKMLAAAARMIFYMARYWMLDDFLNGQMLDDLLID